MSFYLQRANAVLEEVKSKRNAKGDDELELDNEIVLRMPLQNQGAHDAANFFFPGYSVVEDRIAELDGVHPGIKTTVKLTPPAMTFVIYDASGNNKVFSLTNTTIRGSVSFNIDHKGLSSMRLKIGAKFSDDNWKRLKDYLGADVLISAMEMQADMFTTGPRGLQIDLEEEMNEMSGADLRERREDKGWTREELANEADMSAKSIGRYERGERVMTADVIEKIKAAFEGDSAETPTTNIFHSSDDAILENVGPVPTT